MSCTMSRRILVLDSINMKRFVFFFFRFVSVCVGASIILLKTLMFFVEFYFYLHNLIVWKCKRFQFNGIFTAEDFSKLLIGKRNRYSYCEDNDRKSFKMSEEWQVNSIALVANIQNVIKR